MSLVHRFLGAANALLKEWLGLQVVRSAEWADLRRRAGLLAMPSPADTTLPAGAQSYLRRENPRLRELKAKLEALDHPAARHSQWSEQYVSGELDLRFFRGDNAFVWQARDLNTEGKHMLSAHHVRRLDDFGLLRRLKEDGLFGAQVHRFADDVTVSRDLLDSIVQIYFLERHLGISKRPGCVVLDIGAGYGRLAHRMVQALPAVERYICVDAVAEATFVSEYYLRYRGVDARAKVVPLHDVETALASQPVHVAVNVNSFSECSLASIEWWLDLLRRHGVRHLLLIPNADTHGGTMLLSRERDGRTLDMLPSITSRGYRLVVREPKFDDPDVQRHGISPTHHYLFELSPAG
jgi:putative sugar O-methyltransferase